MVSSPKKIKKIKIEKKVLAASETLPCGAKVVGYESRHPLYTDAQANKYGPAIDWLREALGGGVTTRQIVEAWRKGKVEGLTVPQWVVDGLSIGFTPDVRASAEKNWNQEARVMARGYGVIIVLKSVTYSLPTNHVRKVGTSPQAYGRVLDALKKKETGAAYLQDLIDVMRSALNKYETAVRALRSFLGPGIPILRQEVARLQVQLDRIAGRSAGGAAA